MKKFGDFFWGFLLPWLPKMATEKIPKSFFGEKLYAARSFPHVFSGCKMVWSPFLPIFVSNTFRQNRFWTFFLFPKMSKMKK
jgi:hypothetical protein